LTGAKIRELITSMDDAISLFELTTFEPDSGQGLALGKRSCVVERRAISGYCS